MASVELRRVSKVFPRGVTALRDVDLEVHDGEILALLGPNGSGKTTLLRLIAGLERTLSGEIRIGGQVVNGLAPRRRNVAMLFQGCALYPHLTVERNIALGLSPRNGGWPARIRNQLASLLGAAEMAARPPEIRDRVRHTAQLLGVEHLLERYPRQLSGGERQRVALGRALVRQPAVFLLDEPWSNVDARLRQQLRLELRRLRQEFGGTVILVTHDHLEALAIGDRIAVLESGRLHQIGSPREIIDDPRTRFVAEFVGGSPMNFVAGWLRLRDGRLWFESDALRLKSSQVRAAHGSSPDQAVWVGFRADAVSVQTHAVNDVPAVRGVVVGSETLADELQLFVQPLGRVAAHCASDPLVVKAASGSSFHIGQNVWLVVDVHRIHAFGQPAGERVYLGWEAKPNES